MLPEDEELTSLIRSLPTTRVDSFFYRLIPLQRVNSPTSPEGARLNGGRFNPPAELAEGSYTITGGFGLLYTATNPVTSLFECRHILRGLGGTQYQFQPSNPAVMVTISARDDRVLDLTNDTVLAALGLTKNELISLDNRYIKNPKGAITPLQRLGLQLYKSGNFSGILTTSQYDDVFPGLCFDFLPDEVKPTIVDSRKVLDHVQYSE